MHLTARVFASRETGARLDAHREDDTLYIDITLPGPDPASIDITVDGDLSVRAGRRPDGVAERRIQLTEKLDPDWLEARYEDGICTVRIPQAGVSARTEAS